MTAEEFRSTNNIEKFSPALRALWQDAHGQWEKAHELAQAAGDSDGDWVHAYLHRKEGDETNASYWYNRSRHRKPTLSFSEEWVEIASSLLRSGASDRG